MLWDKDAYVFQSFEDMMCWVKMHLPGIRFGLFVDGVSIVGTRVLTAYCGKLVKRGKWGVLDGGHQPWRNVPKLCP